MTDIDLTLPDFLDRRNARCQAILAAAPPPRRKRLERPPTFKPYRRKRKASRTITQLKHLGWPRAAINRLTPREAEEKAARQITYKKGV